MSKIILIRGNSGSGKTTVANELHDILGPGNLLISQDCVRRTMLKVKDKPMNLAIGLIETMIDYGIKNCEHIIIEGILARNKYGEMLRNTLKRADIVNAYYYDLSLEETIKRHNTKENTDFNSNKMREWFVPHDFLGIENEKIISENISKEEMIKLILADLT
ncbi:MULTISPECIES: AAA family ATPase [Vagococcus]|uniref:Putative kinase n=1 Tax=Vagococcus fluvialis bH819 TaxID=1255619 RepID=A0A1X6WKA4_9ENTE|nr:MULTISPECIES: AAA family ATPase [Vagococcus]SLM84753.1 putative kinase [Vagococcus fluvialis bH819]HCM89785.1 hypothetical protein [Vagococcus sp.]